MMGATRGLQMIAAMLAIPLFFWPAAGLTWGEQGHRVIGLIAEHYLERDVRRKIDALLAQDTSGLADSTSIADESVWADRFRDSDRSGSQVRYRQTQAWHYVDLETGQPDLVAACEEHGCIVEKISEFKKQLADTAEPPERRLLALQYLLHFVGDLHQPLHAADRHDRGGNDVLTKSNSARSGNLPPILGQRLCRRTRLAERSCR